MQIICFNRKYVNIMSKYSSDSDSYSDRRNNTKYSRSRELSYSSDSSSSRKRYKDIKKCKRDGSRSKDSRGSDKYARHKKDRSTSYQTKSYFKSSRYSTSPDRLQKRSTSRDRYKLKHRRSREHLRRSRSNDSKDRYKKSRKSDSRGSSKLKDKLRSDSSASNSSNDKNQDNPPETSKTSEIIKNKLKKLTVVKDEDPKFNSIVLDEINDDNFQPKTFSSSKTKKNSENIVIDLKSQTIKIPDVEITEPDSIFHPSLFLNEEVRMEKWIKELYVYRQKALCGDLLNG